MLHTLNDFFRSLLDASPPVDEPASAHTLQLAIAALLVEMMRSDAHTTEAERRTVLDALREKFALDEDELAHLFERAKTASRDATDFYHFTSQINKGFNPAQKVRIVEYLWQVALADGRLSPHENHLMRKLGELLYIPHADYVAAKERARERVNRVTPSADH